MSYLDICVFGWNLNAFMFVVNLLLAVRVVNGSNQDLLREQTEKLAQLKAEFDQYYPNRKAETMISYLVPFTAFFRMSFRLIELMMFLTRNKNTTMYDFMVYKYTSEIEKKKNI